MKKHLSLYLYFAKQTIREELVLRSSFLTGIIGQWLYYGGTCLSLYIMISNFNMLGGWNPYETMALFAFTMLSYAIGATVFFTPCRRLAAKIRTGEFDDALTKPIDPLWYEINKGFNFGYIGHTILSLVILFISLPRTQFLYTAWNFLLLLIMLLGAAFMQAALLLFPSAFAFFTVGDNPFISMFTHNLKRFVDYPISIYSMAVQVILTFVLPYAFLIFYPLGILLEKHATFSFPTVIAYLSPLIGAGCFLLSVKFWRWALRYYQSTGS
jgi:ABC-2 type transport system permease protein